jgi:hypothetical protein
VSEHCLPAIIAHPTLAEGIGPSFGSAPEVIDVAIGKESRRLIEPENGSGQSVADSVFWPCNGLREQPRALALGTVMDRPALKARPKGFPLVVVCRH